MKPREPTFDLEQGLQLFRWGDNGTQLRRHYPDVQYGETDMYAAEMVHFIDEFIQLADGSWLDCMVGKPSSATQSIWMRAYDIVDPMVALTPLLEKVGAKASADGEELVTRVGKTEVAIRFDRREISLWLDHALK